MTRLGLGCLAALCLLVAIAAGVAAACALIPLAPLHQDLGGHPRATIYGVVSPLDLIWGTRAPRS